MKLFKQLAKLAFLSLIIFVSKKTTAQDGDMYKFGYGKQMLGKADIEIDGTVRKDFDLLMWKAPVPEMFGGYYYLATNFLEDNKNPTTSPVRLGVINLGHHAAEDAADSTTGKPNMCVAPNFYPSSVPALAVVNHPQTKQDVLIALAIEKGTNAIKYFVLNDPKNAGITESGTLSIDPAKYGTFTQLTACGVGAGRICVVGRLTDGTMACILYQYQLQNNIPSFKEINFLTNLIGQNGGDLETAADKKISILSLNTPYHSAQSFSLLLSWIGTDNNQSLNVASVSNFSGLFVYTQKYMSKNVSDGQGANQPNGVTLYKKNADPDDKETGLFWSSSVKQNFSTYLAQFAYDDASTFTTFTFSQDQVNTYYTPAAFPMGVNGDGIAIVYSRPLLTPNALAAYPFMVKGRKFSYRNWQGAFLKDELTLDQVVLPGSHNAGMNEEQGWDVTNFLLSNGACNNCNAITQTYRVGKQLEYGFRYIDAKLAVPTFGSKLVNYRYCSTPDICYGESFDEELDEIKEFLTKNPLEFVILNVQTGAPSLSTTASEVITAKLGGMLFYPQFSSSTLNDMIKTPLSYFRGKVILTSPDDDFKNKTAGCLKDIFEVSNSNAHRYYSPINARIEDMEIEQYTFVQGAGKGNYKRIDWTPAFGKNDLLCDLRPLQTCFEKDNATSIWHHFVHWAKCGWETFEVGKTLLEMAGGDPEAWVKAGGWLLSASSGTSMEHAIDANKDLAVQIGDMITEGMLSKSNRPNIIYVDGAEPWISDLCIDYNIKFNDYFDVTLNNSLMKVDDVHVAVGCGQNLLGAATVNVSGGHEPYSYEWEGRNEISNTLSSVPAGQYKVKISDSWGKTVTRNVHVEENTNGYGGLAAQAVTVQQYLPLYATRHYAVDCSSLIAKIESGYDTHAIHDTVKASVWLDNAARTNYAPRHFEIIPRQDTLQATGKVTLYFTQADFDRYNATAAGSKLPASPSDEAGISNIFVELKPGHSSNGSGVLESYGTAAENIFPKKEDIMWNATSNRWEISFYTKGFGGFFVKTMQGRLEQWMTATAIFKNNHPVISWQVEEKNVKGYYVEYSYDKKQFADLGYFPSLGMGKNDYLKVDTITHPATANVVYYRVRQIRWFGESKITGLIAVNIRANKNITAYPNPFAGQLNIITKEPTDAFITDAVGRVVIKMHLDQGTNTIQTTGWAKGFYILVTKEGENIKLIKN